MGLTLENAGALVPGTKSTEVVMKMESVRVLRKFYMIENGINRIQEIGKVLMVSEVEAKGLIASNKAEAIPDIPSKIEMKKGELAKEQPKSETPKVKEPEIKTKKEVSKNDSI